MMMSARVALPTHDWVLGPIRTIFLLMALLEALLTFVAHTLPVS